MKRSFLIRSSILLVILLLVIAGVNARALSQFTIYFPLAIDGPAESTSPSISSPSTTEPPTTELPPGPSGNVVIRDIFYDGVVGTNEPGEYFEICNDDSFPIQLNNCTLSDAENHVFTFPSFVIQPNQTCWIYTNQVHSQWYGFSYGSGSAIWNNTGDTATLRDRNGTLIDEHSF